MKRPPIRVLEAAGTAEELGATHGRLHAEEIRKYTNDRIDLVTSGLWSGDPLTRANVLDLAESMLAEHEQFDAALHQEMLSMASAAGITPAEAVVGGGFTDFVDAVRAVHGGPHPDSVVEDDCTAVIVPDSRTDGGGFLAQTWDMHDSATDHVVLLRLRPVDSPAVTVFSTVGCLGQIGMNEAGLAVGINNLTGADGRVGVTWPSVVRAMLATETADDALAVLLSANLAGAHNFLILDAAGSGYNIEAMPSSRPVVPLQGQPLIHTNHVLDADASRYQATKASALMDSSAKRLETAHTFLADGPIDSDRLIALTREPDAICQRASEPFHIESSGAAIMRPRTSDFWACWGVPTENEFVHFGAIETVGSPS